MSHSYLTDVSTAQLDTGQMWKWFSEPNIIFAKSNTVECRYNMVRYYMIFHTVLQWLKYYVNQFILTKDAQNLALMDEIWGAYCQSFRENRPHHNPSLNCCNTDNLVVTWSSINKPKKFEIDMGVWPQFLQPYPWLWRPRTKIVPMENGSKSNSWHQEMSPNLPLMKQFCMKLFKFDPILVICFKNKWWN